MKTGKYALIVFLLIFSCKFKEKESSTPITKVDDLGISLVVLGTIQDAGSPHIGCKKECCADLFNNPDTSRKVVSLGVIDSENKSTYLFEATPDISTQLKILKNSANFDAPEIPNGIFLTHAHIGHYSGLMYLGKEATNAKEVPVFAMSKMKKFLTQNGPWSQLVNNKNITLRAIKNDSTIVLNNNLKVIPFTVPHRDEFSETVGYKIIGPNRTALFIPDIDKWEKWERNIVNEIAKVDYAFLDATFFDGEEINNRDISEIPHPFIIESMELFKNLPSPEKDKINFIHFNHTNPAPDIKSKKAKQILKNGFNIAQFLDVFEL